ncbi:MBL fold metallo-hydrolase [Limnobacter humi]|uniref:MBL fold metallo-hydrolase n=1 Tax=Limnobacter humi TaxID=1778671 RepID=A0ABT1WDR1_9BURK|nr:MBL fold metallo-hydrolase [Limnobacter humi]MCQ8895514.1 MBL fold metallo-hydrolase [Limnobacter humi]
MLLARLALSCFAAMALWSVSACMDGSTTPGAQQPSANIQPAETRPQVFGVNNFKPLPAAPQVDPVTQAARDRILGPNAVDQSTVKLWWVGVSSFIVAGQGHVFLLDAWEIVGLHANYVPIGREELAAIKPEAILVGHGHFDHAADVGYVAGHSGAVVVAGSTVCDLARQRAADAGLNATFPCVNLGDDTNTQPGSLQSLKLWEDLPEVTILRHTHSAAEPTDLLSGGRPLVFIPDVLTYPTYLNTSPQETAAFLGSLRDDGGVGQPDGGTWAYHFQFGDFTLFWHDSAGVMKAGNPDSLAIQQAIARLPGCVDVQLNAIVGFGMVTSAYRDALAYVAAAHPKLALPTHHDAWAPGIGGGAKAYEQTWREAVASLPSPPALDYLTDPMDYMKPRVFNINDPRWSGGCR